MLRQKIPTLLAALFLCFSSYAQLTRGFISGTVQDVSGAVVEGVRITANNTDTGIKRETVTNSAGVYRFVAVEPGPYELEFSKTGFETRKVGGLQVGTTQELVLNQTLGVSTVTTSVEVLESPPGVELAKSTPTNDRKLDQQLVESIPTTGLTRDITRLALLAPMAVRATGSTEISVNGQRARNNNFTIDGVDNNDVSITNFSARVIAEQVSEFQIQTAPYSAEFGRSSGGQISVITKSGTNQFHGEVWDYYAANWMEPLSLPQKRSGVTDRPRYNQNQAGGDIGGRIIRDKTFFFGLIEANRRREAPNADNATNINIPTPQGFAALSSVPLGPDQSPQSRQAVLGALSFLPDIHRLIGDNYSNRTNVNINGVQIPVGSARIPLANPRNYWTNVARIDHQLTSKDSLSYRNQFDKQERSDVNSNLGFGQRFSASTKLLAQSHALSHTRAFSPSLINEFRFSYGRRNLAFPENDPITPTVIITGGFTVGGSSNFPQGRIQNTFQYQDVATHLAGRHSLKMGGDYRRVRLLDINGFDTKGTWRFDSLAEFINNRATQLTQAVTTATSDSRQNLAYFFFQDDFKATRDLTLNLGLRYEFTSYPFGLFGATLPEVRAVGVPGPARPDKNNWAPRFGLAYSPSSKEGWSHKLFGNGQTVFRGGYGVGYDVVFFNLLSNSATNYPRVTTDNRFAVMNLFPTLLPPTTSSPVFNPLAQYINSLEDTQNPTTHFYSFSIQREFSKNYIFELGYSGNRSYHQIGQGQLNPGILTPEQAQTVIATRSATGIPALQQRRLHPEWGSRVTFESNANSNYNAMFLRFDKKMSHGLLLGANYTWSALLSDNDESLGVTDLADVSPQVPQDFRNKRPDWSRSAFDRPHRFVVHYSYQTPWFSSGFGNSAVLRQIFKGWQVSGSSEWQSGQPFTIRTGVDSLGNGSTAAARPNYNPDGIFLPDPVDGNLRTFTSPVNGTGRFVVPLAANGMPLANSMPFGGNLAKNSYRGPSFTQWNMSLSKIFSITERWKLHFRNDFINMFNHRNFGPPENRMVSPAFGQNTRDQVATFGRSMLASVKITF